MKSRLLFFPMMVYERIVNYTEMLSWLRVNIFCAAKKYRSEKEVLMRKFSSYTLTDPQVRNTVIFYKEILNKILDNLPEKKVFEIISFAMFIKEHSNDETHIPLIRAIPATELNGLIGIVNWGGDAVDDTERLFEE